MKGTSFYSIDKLKRIFKISDDRTIETTFGKNLIIKDCERGVESKFIEAQIGFLPKKPLLTRDEAQKRLGVGLTQINALIKSRELPYVNLKNSKGCANLFLESDVERLKNTFVTYSYARPALVDHTRKLTGVLEKIIDSDFCNGKNFVKNIAELETLKSYLLDGKNLQEIADEEKCSKENIRMRLDNSMTKFDYFLDYMSNEYSAYEKLQKENKILLHKIEVMEGVIKNDVMPNFADIERLFNDDIMSLYNVLCCLPLMEYSNLDMSVRLRNILIQYCESIGTSIERVCFKFLLEIPIGHVAKFRGIGKTTLTELRGIISDSGFIPNEGFAQYDIHISNIMEKVADKEKVANFYKGYYQKSKMSLL